MAFWGKAAIARRWRRGHRGGICSPLWAGLVLAQGRGSALGEGMWGRKGHAGASDTNWQLGQICPWIHADASQGAVFCF